MSKSMSTSSSGSSSSSTEGVRCTHIVAAPAAVVALADALVAPDRAVVRAGVECVLRLGESQSADGRQQPERQQPERHEHGAEKSVSPVPMRRCAGVVLRSSGLLLRSSGLL